jgi:hypothetical protein
VYGTDYTIDDDGVYHFTTEGKENAANKAKNNRINSAIAENAGELATNAAKKEKTVSDNEDKYKEAVNSLFNDLSTIDSGLADK